MLIMDTTSEGSIRRQCYVWFADSPFRPSGYDTVVFKEACRDVSNNQFSAQQFHTLFSNLRLSENELWEKLNKGKRKAIRRAQNRGWSVTSGQSHKDIGRFHAAQMVFASSKKIGLPLPIEVLQRNAKCCIFAFGHDKDGKTVCWISYVLDKPIIRELFTGYDLTYDRSALGYGTALMRWEMMLHFKRHGFETYDWGGVTPDTTSPLYSITQYKLQFGGTPETRFDYVCRYPLSRPKRLWRQLGLLAKRYKV